MPMMTDRHKKPGGFQKLINSLEITPDDRRKKIIEAMRVEDPKFAEEVEKYIFVFDEFKDTPDMVMTDIMYGMRNDMRSVAIALYKCADEALLLKFTKNMLPPQAAAYREESSMLAEITQREQSGARFRVIAKARELQNSRVIMLKKYSPLYANE